MTTVRLAILEPNSSEDISNIMGIVEVESLAGSDTLSDIGYTYKIVWHVVSEFFHYLIDAIFVPCRNQV